MLLAVYLAYLGIGVHMTTFLIMPISAVVFLLRKETTAKVWFMVGAFFLVELFLIFALSSKAREIPWYFPAAVSAVIYIFYVLSQERIPGQALAICLGLGVTCLPGLAALGGLEAPAWTALRTPPMWP